MFKYEERIVNTSKLRPCPVKITLHTFKMVRDLTNVVKSNPERIEPIVVAIVGSDQYVANGDLRVSAFQHAGKNSIMAWCINVETIADVVRLHIELNTHGSINPIKMTEALQFLEKYDVSPMSIDKRYRELAKKILYPTVLKEWEDFIEITCRKYPNIEIPLHIIERIADFSSEKEQLTATTVILDTVRTLKPNRFVFPAPPALEIILSSISQRQVEKEVIVFEPQEPEEEWSRPIIKDAENLIRGSSYNSLAHCKCGRDLLLDTKTHRVSDVNLDTENKCIKLVDGDGSATYFISPAVIEFLGLEEGQSLRIVTITGHKDLVKFAKNLSGTSRLAVLTCN